MPQRRKDSREESSPTEGFKTSDEESTGIDLSDTSDTTLIPESFVPLPASPLEPKAAASKWKPLVGTPSKPPVPDNIFVPDRSPASTCSFAQRRRQGEHVQRPPVWKIYKMEDDFDGSRDGEDDCSAESDCGMRDLEFSLNHRKMDPGDGRSDFRRFDWMDFGFSGDVIDKQLIKMADVFMDKPLIVNVMQNPDLPLLPSKHSRNDELALASPAQVSAKNATTLSPVPESPVTSPLNADIRAGDGLEINASSPLGSKQAPISQKNNDKGEAQDVVVQTKDNSQPRDSSSFEMPRPRRNKGKGKARVIPINPPNPYRGMLVLRRIPNKTPKENPAPLLGEGENKKISQDQGTSGSSHKNSTAESDGPKTYNAALDPKRYCHFELHNPTKNGDFIDEYVDIRVASPADGNLQIQNKIVPGSHVAFVGRTEFVNANGRACEVGLPTSSQYYVDRIFGDGWALCLKLQPGLETAMKRNHSLGGIRKLKPPKHLMTGIPLVPVKNHPIIVVYVPLCALTLVTNLGAFQLHMQAPKEPSAKSAASQGGLVKAAPRSFSDKFEADTKRSRIVWVSEMVYDHYMDFCAVSQKSLSSLENEAAVRENIPNPERSNVLEVLVREDSARGTATDRNEIVQKWRDTFNKGHQDLVDTISAEPKDQSRSAAKASHPRQKQPDKPPASKVPVSVPLSTELVERYLDTLDGDVHISAIPKANPRSGNAQSTRTGEWVHEVHPVWRQPADVHEIRLDDDLPAYNESQAPTSSSDRVRHSGVASSEGRTKNRQHDDPHSLSNYGEPSARNPDRIEIADTPTPRIQSADTPTPRIKKGKAKRSKRKSIAGIFLIGSWGISDDEAAPPTQDPRTMSTRKSLHDKFLTLMGSHRQPRPSILPRAASIASGASRRAVFSSERNGGPSESHDQTGFNRDVTDVSDAVWDAGIEAGGSRRQRFNRAWKSFKAKRTSQPPRLTNPWENNDENRHPPVETAYESPLGESENRPLAIASQSFPPFDCDPSEIQGPPAAPEKKADPKPWDISEAERSRILSELVEDGGSTSTRRDRLLAMPRRKSCPGENIQDDDEDEDENDAEIPRISI